MSSVGTVETRVPRAGLPRPTTQLQEISLRTRLSKPGEAPHAWRSLAKDFSLGEGPLLERAPSQRLGKASSLAGVFFLAEPALSPRQSAHGLCVPRRVTDAPKRDDDSVVVAILVYKAVNKAAPRKGGPRLATLVIRRSSAAADEDNVTVGVTPELLQRRPTVLAGRWLF